MSEHTHDIPVPERFDGKLAGGLPKLFLLGGVVGLVGSLISAFISARLFAFSWLFGFQYFFSLAVGCLFWCCLHHATDSDWSVVVRRQMENVARLLPWLGLLFVPVLLVPHHLWSWWDVKEGVDLLLDGKRGYLSKPFFLGRAAAYFILLGGLAWLLGNISSKQDQDGKGSRTLLMRKLGIAGIPLVGLGITFSAFDWLMGLDYHWFSTMWGVYNFAGAAGASMSLLVIIVVLLQEKGYLKIVNSEHFHTMGKLMLAFSIFWAYIGFSQYMLIWYANIPEETIYFRIRNTGVWWYLSTALMLFRFWIPLPILLTQWVKRDPRRLRWMACWILIMQILDVFIIVMPVYEGHGFGFGQIITCALTFVGMGGILGWLFLRNLGANHLFPLRDPRLVNSLKLTN